MQLTLKQLAIKPSARISCNSKPASMRFFGRYNEERPHQALAMQVPAEVYIPSERPYRGVGELDYPLHDWASTVTHCGRICFKGRKVNLSQVFAGQLVGVRKEFWRRRPDLNRGWRFCRAPRWLRMA